MSSNVITLRPALNIDDRAFAAMKTLANTLEELEDIRLESPVTLQFFGMELDKADKDIALLRSRLRTRQYMKDSLVHLDGVMGRAP